MSDRERPTIDLPPVPAPAPYEPPGQLRVVVTTFVEADAETVGRSIANDLASDGDVASVRVTRKVPFSNPEHWEEVTEWSR